MSDESDLSEPHGRLRWARKQAGFETARAASEALRIPYQTYVSHENGNSGFRLVADRYALFFRVSLDWLLTGRGAPKGRSRLEEIFEELPADKKRQAIDYLEFLRGRGD